MPQRGFESIERIVELLAGDGRRAPVIAELAQRQAGERDGVADAVEAAHLGDRAADDFATRIRQRDEMAGEIAAIDR